MFLKADPAPTNASVAPGRYVLVFDDDCSFCRFAAPCLRKFSRVSIELLPLTQIEGLGILESLSNAELRASAHLVAPDGQEFHGGESVTRALRLAPGGALIAFLDLPGVNRLRATAYRYVVAHRQMLARFASRSRADSLKVSQPRGTCTVSDASEC
jgi:predicted DCC family thiol-disulfide oxidoreductase YuxK